MNTTYPLDYFRRLASGESIEPPNKSQSGQYFDALTVIYETLRVFNLKNERIAAFHSTVNTLEDLMPGVLDSLLSVVSIPAGVTILGHGDGWTLIPSQDLDKLPDIEYLLPNKVPKRGLTVIYGASGTFKSFIALDYALQIAQSESVVYMIGEDESGYKQRVRAWELHNQKSRKKLLLSLGAVPVLDNAQVKLFIDAIKEYKPALVIVDTLARAFIGGDENSSRDMGLFVRACDKIARSCQCAVLLVHHTNKNSENERGSSALRGASDSMIKVTALDNQVEIENSKTKNSKPFELERYIFVPVPATESGVLVESERVVLPESVAKMSELTQTQAKVLRGLCEYLDGSGSANEISEMINLPRATVQRTVKQLIRLKLVRQANKGQPYEALAGAWGLLGISNPNESLESLESLESQESLDL